MLLKSSLRLFVLSSLLLAHLHGSSFLLDKKENNTSDPTLLVIGGIHGNEPGGYFATAMLMQYYEITKGNLWIVPDLNRPSIQANSRGVHGDMNRKFSAIAPSDQDAPAVSSIKKTITDDQVSLVLNLHDGHGFYRQNYTSTIFNPNAWGQTCVIDQCNLSVNQPFGNLEEIAKKVSKQLNSTLLEEHHTFNVKNTQTKFDDEAMQLSLTYFAVTHNKPAFAIETSKNLSTLAEKVYYQLNAIESFMKIMGISYHRHFTLSKKSVKNLLENYGKIVINNKISLNLNDIRNNLSFIPLPLFESTFSFTHPLGSVKQVKGDYVLYIGNKIITNLKPEHFKTKDCISKLPILVDGDQKDVTIASETFVTADFKVNASDRLRVNIIGYTDSGKKNENGCLVALSDLNSKFSLDNAKRRYRIELYDDNSFCGMITVKFKKDEGQWTKQ
ncbi:MAG: M99 family carboxypeptidase catalytic domain-containing protein [Campylobacterota bacterium]|nr:M99 family carboxypeptidase catalytic domain-containing protein [Campylobacterota bacterium]